MLVPLASRRAAAEAVRQYSDGMTQRARLAKAAVGLGLAAGAVQWGLARRGQMVAAAGPAGAGREVPAQPGHGPVPAGRVRRRPLRDGGPPPGHRQPVDRKWARLRSLGALLEHWFAAHRTFEEDAARLRQLLVVKYEHLVADPAGTLAGIAGFLELDGEIPAGGIDTRRSATYERQWAELAGGGPVRRERFRSLCRRYQAAAAHFGYSLVDLERADPFPVGSTRPS